ncbi:MAG: flagellar hook assembly protein FlgD [Porticoccus sp.]
MESTTNISELFPSTLTTTPTKNNPNELGQEDFMTLMVAQLKNQDPTKPMDNMQMLTQVAQFGTVSGIQGVQEGVDNLSSVLYSNQALEAAGLVGRQVMTDSNMGVLRADKTLDATIDLPQNADGVTLYVQNMSGRLVHSQALGPASAGDLKVQWDGTDAAGNRLLPGQYRISAEALMGGQNQAASVYTHSQVESVTVDRAGTGVLLNLAGGAQVGMSGVKSFL